MGTSTSIYFKNDFKTNVFLNSKQKICFCSGGRGGPKVKKREIEKEKVAKGTRRERK